MIVNVRNTLPTASGRKPPSNPPSDPPSNTSFQPDLVTYPLCNKNSPLKSIPSSFIISSILASPIPKHKRTTNQVACFPTKPQAKASANLSFNKRPITSGSGPSAPAATISSRVSRTNLMSGFLASTASLTCSASEGDTPPPKMMALGTLRSAGVAAVALEPRFNEGRWEKVPVQRGGSSEREVERVRVVWTTIFLWVS